MSRKREAAPTDKRRDWRATAGIGGFTAVAAVLSLTVHVPTTPIAADLIVNAVSFRIAVAETLWTDKALAPLDVTLGGLASAELDMDSVAGAGDDVEAEGSDLALAQLALPAGASVTFEGGVSGTAIYVRDGVAEGSIAIRAGNITAPKTRRRVLAARSSPPARVVFKGPATGSARPLRIGITGAHEWTVELRAQAFDFRSEQPEGSRRFVSTVRGGAITVSDAQRTVQVLSRDSVIIGLSEPARHFEIRDSSGLLRVSVQGKASSVAAGPSGRLVDLRPSWAEYLYRAERVKLLWAALTLVWGLAWSVRKALRK